jgi:DNA helicase II / ATP-dependent DNA helicase PcrA
MEPTKIRQIYMIEFTDEQLQIIHTTSKRTEALAYAGSGKTETLRARIRRLFDQGVTPDQILVLSFSNMAVNILIDRLAGSVTVKTFHAFAQSLVHQHHHVLGLGKKPVLLAPTEQFALVRGSVKASRNDRIAVRRAIGVNLGARDEVKRLAAFFTRILGDGALAKTLVGDSHSEFHCYRKILKPLRRIHRRYLDLKLKEKVIDYSDMLRLGRKALEAGGGLPYQYLFVDECQDMNHGQAALLRVLAMVIPNVMVFGDPYQAVFGFAGGRFWQLSSLMDGVKTFQLTRSFRLTQRTADMASEVAAPLADTPFSIRGKTAGLKPVLVQCKTAHDQAQRVISTVQDIARAKTKPAKIAVLARTKAQLREVEVALLAAGHAIQPLHRNLMPDHMDTLLNVLALAEKCAARKEEGKRIGRAGLERRLLTAAGMADMDIGGRVVAACRRKLLKTLLSPTLEGRYIGVRKAYEKLLRACGALDADIRAELGRWEPLCNRFACVAEFRRYLVELRTRPSVITSTIHRAKGGEWDYVLVLGVTDGSLPFFRELNRDAEDEERRLLYVAATRPRKRLFLFHAPFHHAISGGVYEKCSRFLTPKVRKLLTFA